MLRINRIQYKNVDILRNFISARSATTEAKSQSSSQSENEQIVLPKRINRSPTDLLYALSRTVGKDPTAVHYKYHDDPFLTPKSFFTKDQYALSQESGKRTAQWLKQEQANLFDHVTAQPKIEAFLPKAVITEESDVDVSTLQENIEAFNASDAIMVYKLLVNKEVPVSDDLKQSLLELVCFYNEGSPLPFDLFEERAADAAKKRLRDAKAEEWIDSCFADQLFQSIEPKTPAAYNTMIRALYKFNKPQRAEELFNEAEKNGISLDCATYNACIRNIDKKETTAEGRWDEILAKLKEMNGKNIRPNIHTLNAILQAIKSGGYIHQIREHTLSVLAEFKRLNIDPSLETYSHLLAIFHGKNAPPSSMISNILDELESRKDLIPQSVADFTFFYKAMEACRYRIKNSASYARRIDNIITKSDNIKLIGHSVAEQLYYRHFLCTILHNEPFSDFIELYDQLVPETYALEPSVVEDIFSTINMIGAIQYIPKFWSDMIVCGISNRGEMNDTLLRLMTQNQPIADVSEHGGLVDRFADISWAIYLDLVAEHHSAARREQLLPAGHLANIVILQLRADRFDNAKTIVEACLEQRKDKKIIGSLTDDAISLFINACITNKQPKIAIQLISYAIENGVCDCPQLARKLVESMTLDPTDIRRITDLVGRDVLKPAKKSESSKTN